jgi:hypothetical protein
MKHMAGRKRHSAEDIVRKLRRADELRTFGETRRRAKVIGRFPGETRCISIAWAVLDRASRGWRGLTMTPAGLRQLQDLRRSLLQPPQHLRPQHNPDSASGTTETVSATA